MFGRSSADTEGVLQNTRQHTSKAIGDKQVRSERGGTGRNGLITLAFLCFNIGLRRILQGSVRLGAHKPGWISGVFPEGGKVVLMATFN